MEEGPSSLMSVGPPRPCKSYYCLLLSPVTVDGSVPSSWSPCGPGDDAGKRDTLGEDRRYPHVLLQWKQYGFSAHYGPENDTGAGQHQLLWTNTDGLIEVGKVTSYG